MLHYILENEVESHAYEDVAQPVGLVLVPTRELAIQIFHESRKFSLNTMAKNICIYGGVATNHQMRRMKVFVSEMFCLQKQIIAVLQE